ncbi:D-alanyl-D-alanine carboxypeptidase (penicillin-binding protein 5/6) [Natranaerovirga hydrolytica]|uniref:serine-type D-Ala-D-Ala carboxypeptidase n=1 Tax=Natranaerovirga hydrolytica TaxID=680378 RepID=A0A4R1MXX8_9FIRM|nr:D-alanyl-D-alanine carboxypeptidase family protein [Natranaerovirga hydrolytica]TCK97975.1 D-alanyl-D-alanine carboxypeptidase (penicillin-binding protein 5/6) [Natranaerovirga hydrolytica]
MKKIISIIMVLACTSYIFNTPVTFAEETNTEVTGLELQSRSAILMEPTSGKVIYEKNAHESLKPASVTKIMTLLLVFEALENGTIQLEDEVVVSEHAASMGGSQVYLEPNEIQTVEDMIKCIAIASANDASVAMAEHLAGSELFFIQAMNNKAKELGMENTNFMNSNGLDHDDHYMSAYDIAIMSKELITKYPQVLDYTTIWQDSIIHRTKRGEEEFGLTSTNKLIKWYNGATGLKTGSTSKALYCLSGTANRDGMDLIAVVMAAPDYKTRFEEVMELLDYGFANVSLYEDNIKGEIIKEMPVKKGKENFVHCVVKDDFSYVMDKENSGKEVTKELVISEYLEAPISLDDVVGQLVYKIDGNEIGKVDVVAQNAVERTTFSFSFGQVIKMLFG